MRLKHIILNAITVLTLVVVPVLSTGVAYAADPPKKADPPAKKATPCPTGDTAKANILQGVGQTGDDCSDDQVDQVFRTIVQILSLIIGIASVIVILISGFKYITSGGEANRVSNAKNTLIYAMIGLFVAAIAQLLIHFVLFQANRIS